MLWATDGQGSTQEKADGRQGEGLPADGLACLKALNPSIGDQPTWATVRHSTWPEQAAVLVLRLRCG